MTDRPIPFIAPMVRALLDGTKTQTRRVLKPQPPAWIRENDKPGYSCLTPKGHIEFRGNYVDDEGLDHGPAAKFIKLPYAKGDRLWVREAYYQRGHWEPVEGKLTKGRRQKWAFVPADDITIFEEPESFRRGRHHLDPYTVAWHKRLCRFMPRKFSRLTLTVTGVRVQRLQDISEEDAIAEGILVGPPLSSMPESHGDIYHDGATDPIDGWTRNPVEAYQNLWTHINGPDAWEANPWVVAVSFTVEQRNIDAIGAAA